MLPPQLSGLTSTLPDMVLSHLFSQVRAACPAFCLHLSPQHPSLAVPYPHVLGAVVLGMGLAKPCLHLFCLLWGSALPKCWVRSVPASCCSAVSGQGMGTWQPWS